MISAALRVALVAVSLALDVFAVSVGVGVAGVNRKAMVRIGASFAAAEIAMNLIGVGIGSVVGKAIGGLAAYLGFAALIGVGLFMLIEALRGGEGAKLDLSAGWGLLVASLSISLDSLGIGFTIVYIGVPIAVTLVAIGVASIASTFLGLAFGKRFGLAVGERAGVAAGIVLMLTGAGFAYAKYSGHG